MIKFRLTLINKFHFFQNWLSSLLKVDGIVWQFLILLMYQTNVMHNQKWHVFVQDIFMIDFHGHSSIKSTNLQSRTQPVKRCYKSKAKFAEYITFACRCLGVLWTQRTSLSLPQWGENDFWSCILIFLCIYIFPKISL